MGLSVLVVDDSKFMRQDIKNALSYLKIHSVIEAKNGMDAIRAFRKYRPPLITIDYEMPGLNGIETAAKIREMDKNVKMIIVTSIKSNMIAVKSGKIPNLGYITKPIDPLMIKKELSKIQN
ncbi:MAG: response regulator transcription factor [Nitrosopumilus sp.]